MTDLHKITFLVATDPDFRKALLDNPGAALAQQGLEASSEELSALTRVLDLVAQSPEGLFEHFMASPEPLPWQLQAPVNQTKSGSVAAQSG
jgi:hypothetical protein